MYMKLLQENGDYLLQENGDKILLEQYWYDLSLGIGTFSMAGLDVAFNIGRGILLEVGSYISTGYDVTINSFRRAYLTVGEFILTGLDAIIKTGKSFRDKPRILDFTINKTPLNISVKEKRIQNSNINSVKPRNLK